MSTSQSHGKQFEDHLKAALFPGAADHGRSPTSGFDVEASFNKERGVPCSIKVAKQGSSISLADARRFWEIQQPFELIVSEWTQRNGTQKEFETVHRFFITSEIHQDLIAQVTAEQVARFHAGLKTFGPGQHRAARDWARQQKIELAPFLATSRIILNPKIDSKDQRRLQCSVKLASLVAVTEGRTVVHQGQEIPLHEVRVDHIGALCLPFGIVSVPRSFR